MTSLETTVRRYYYLAKPGIVYGNCLSAVAGFLLASQGNFDWPLFVALMAGIALVIGGSCVVNNYLDRGIDSKMARTSKRALVTGKVGARSALLYAVALLAIGFGLLIAFTNALTVWAGLVGAVFYVVVYGAAKRLTVWGTVIGSVSGAIPITAGYLAVSDSLDRGAVLLFLAMACWQMPHFYAIALYRLDDYRAAGLPVLPAVRSARRTKLSIMAYIVAFAAVCVGLSINGYTGAVFLVASLLLNTAWLYYGYRGWQPHDDAAWAKQMFRFSLLVLLVFCLLLSVDWLLP